MSNNNNILSAEMNNLEKKWINKIYWFLIKEDILNKSRTFYKESYINYDSLIT